jgi:NitT/TauT family transport system permease protein
MNIPDKNNGAKDITRTFEMTAHEHTSERSKKIRRIFKVWFPPILVFIIGFTFWTLSIDIFDIPTYLLPSPGRLFTEVTLRFNLFISNGVWTLAEAIAGFLLGGGIGLLLGATLALSKSLERGCLPYIVGATTIPIVAFAPLVVIYVGFGIQSKIVVAAIVSFFPLCLYTLKGLLSTDLVQRELFHSLAASRWDVFFKLQVPTSLPFVMTAMKQTSTVAVVAAIIAEYIQAEKGFGYLILSSSYLMDIPRMWAAVLFSSLMAMIFYSLVVLVEKKFVSWHVSMIDERDSN